MRCGRYNIPPLQSLGNDGPQRVTFPYSRWAITKLNAVKLFPRCRGEALTRPPYPIAPLHRFCQCAAGDIIYRPYSRWAMMNLNALHSPYGRLAIMNLNAVKSFPRCRGGALTRPP